jgi:low affinity Fe/Cu permease
MAQAPETNSPWRRPQFGFRALGMFSAIVAMVAAIYGGLIRGGATWPVYVVLACAAPVLLLIVVDGLQWVVRVATSIRESRRGTVEDELAE